MAVVLLMGMVAVTGQEPPPFKIYLDADQTGTKASGLAIEQGIRTALFEVNSQINGRPVQIVRKDHHGSSLRSLRHLKQFIQDPQALVVFSGLHSPPLLDNLQFINQNQVLLLDPWAAAGPITRYKSKQNWVFRLSVDDSKAGSVIVNHALTEGFKKPYLLLEETGWGRSNYKTMQTALAKNNLEALGVQWFNWNLGITGAKMMLRNIQLSGADVILLVANASEGKTIANAMLQLPASQHLAIRSHWGITGGNFAEELTSAKHQLLNLKFIQTRFSFVSSTPSVLSNQVFNNLQQLYPELITSPVDLKAPTGFIHAYDLCKLMIIAMQAVDTSRDIVSIRNQLRLSLESLTTPVTGLIKTYNQPFGPVTTAQPDAHEALDEDDFVMAYFGHNNEIIIDPISRTYVPH